MIIMKNLQDKLGRKYSKDELTIQFSDKFFYGELAQEYLSDTIKLETVSHMFENFRFEGNDLHADLTILKTPQGMILAELIKNDVYIATSLRATGYVDENMNVKNVGVIAIDLMTQISHNVV